MDHDAYRAESRERWEQAAPGWEKRNSHLSTVAMPVSAWLIDAVALQPGATVLELAAGVGETGFLAAELIEPGGRLITSDFSAAMLDAARRRAGELGIDNVDFRELQAEWLDLDAASVDAVICRWGLMLMADPEAALREARRVLRVGGRIALAVWAEADANPWAVLPGRLLVERGLAQPPDPALPGMFALSTPGRLEAMLGDAGFSDVSVTGLELDLRYDDADDWWHMTLDCARPFAAVVDALEEAQRDDLRRALADAAEPFRQHDASLRFPARTLVATAAA